MSDKAKLTHVEIRELTPEFISSFVVLMDKYRVFYGRPSNMEESENYVRQLADNDNVVFLMAVENNDKLIGFCTLFKSFSSVRAAQVLILNDLYIAETHRRCGYGLRLLDSAVSLAKSKGVKFIKLETANDNIKAQELYKAHGWNLSEFRSYNFQID